MNFWQPQGFLQLDTEKLYLFLVLHFMNILKENFADKLLLVFFCYNKTLDLAGSTWILSIYRGLNKKFEKLRVLQVGKSCEYRLGQNIIENTRSLVLDPAVRPRIADQTIGSDL